ncbi:MULTISPECIES: saccharopine dehydrogenase NADP-binding domain-containing protein [unclassified Bradyrhizobium]|uniref:saccharopine dehydrogenase NADP-binding domain-containing protein n=1 Tax=unclassified Bradyrhizobium TaxID=2631580 RepID=UPI001BA71D83|nr:MULTISPECIES: saccharopine dehydrogenase NADP-binding domain-containing protein [unclassified Bradyrhizobium]MBR1228829.1 saccharopine dehydrogenase NADP-binding domain-containing protein [Bradyrhizobium sp. AUGA SZCCT0176]MBR1297426.1 saccharopine dehydrogenase NADP-binding domain-containing protein [Bradyrhizobium sp. AUGA SZCCT0042]
MTHQIGIYGGAGHTAKMVAAELRDRGFVPVLGGRNRAKLEAAAQGLNGVEVRTADIARSDELRAFLSGCSAVVNCAGPFQATAMPIASLAVEQGIHYFDFTTDASIVNALHLELGRAAAAKKLLIAPAIGFYGSLAELMVRASAPDLAAADDVLIAYSVKGWKPTIGSLKAMAELGGRRGVHTNGRFEIRTGEPRFQTFSFPAPVGEAPVLLDYPAPEVVTIPRYLTTSEIRVMMTVGTVKDLRAAPPPDSVSDEERAGTDYIIVTEVTAAGRVYRATLRGGDIYRITAPIIGECVERALTDRARIHGVVSAAEAFDAADMLQQVARHGLTVSFN